MAASSSMSLMMHFFIEVKKDGYEWTMKNWDFEIWSLEIGIWSLDLGFGFGPWDLGFENKRFEVFK